MVAAQDDLACRFADLGTPEEKQREREREGANERARERDERERERSSSGHCSSLHSSIGSLRAA